MFGVTPKAFNAVDVILAAVRKGFTMVQTVVFAPAFQGVVAPKGVGVIDRTFSGMLPNMSHQFIGGYLFHDFGVNPAIALQKAKHNAFPSRPSSSLAFAPATEVRLVNLNLALQLAGLKFGYMVDRFAQTLIDAGNHLIIKAQVARHAIRRLLLVEAGDNANLLAQALERFLFSTGLMPTLHVAASGFANFERTAKNALPAPQKVGRTVENIVSSSNHKDIVAPRGYETH